jgi:hypothetical protein
MSLVFRFKPKSETIRCSITSKSNVDSVMGLQCLKKLLDGGPGSKLSLVSRDFPNKNFFLQFSGNFH